MAIVRTCDRCKNEIPEDRYKQITVHTPDPDVRIDLCNRCYEEFARYFMTGQPKPPVDPASGGPDCPHGSKTAEPCYQCGRRVCNLCGLYAAEGKTYCATHRPPVALQAKGIHVDTARG